MSAHGAGSGDAGRFVPEIWSRELCRKFADAVVFGSSNYMYGDIDPTNALRDLMEDNDRAGIRDWFCRYGRWEKVFAWWPTDTERGKVWLRPLMRSTTDMRGGPVSIHLTVPAFVGYRLDGKIGDTPLVPKSKSKPYRLLRAKK